MKNIVWHNGKISLENRESILNQKGVVLWFTGLSGSGKSTIVSKLEEFFYKMGNLSYVLDGDNIRHGLNNDLDFSEKGRIENIRRISEVVKLYQDTGIITLVSFISPFIKDREMVRNKIKSGRFIEIYVKCSLEECEKRDVKGLYKKAREGEIKDFTGISSPYEEPIKPEIIVETDKELLDDCVRKIIEYLEKKELI